MAEIHYSVVWKSLDEPTRESIMSFWQEHRAVTDLQTARRRVEQAVVLARDKQGRIAGLCTAEARTIPHLRARLFYYRTFVAPQHRHGLAVFSLLNRASEVLAAHSRRHPEEAILGIYMELENPRFGERLRRPVWRRGSLEFVYIGLTPNGQEQRVMWFEHARLDGRRNRITDPSHSGS